MSGTAAAIMIAAVAGALAVLAVGWPLLRREDTERARRADDEAAAAEDAGALEEAIARSLAAIREIEADHRAGHLSDADFAELDAAERARAASLIRRRDAAAGAGA